MHNPDESIIFDESHYHHRGSLESILDAEVHALRRELQETIYEFLR